MNIYVGNLPFDATEEELHALFSSCGTVETIDLATDRETGRPRGFGFVTMASSEEAAKAMETLNGHLLHGRSLQVDAARERENRRTSRSGARDRYSSRY